MTRREEIVVELGGDSRKLMKELNMSKQGVAVFARDIAKEITTGRIPDAWKSYTANIRNALQETKKAEDATNSFGASLGKVAGRLIGLNVIKNIFGTAAAGMRELSEEIARLDKNLDAKPYLDKQRRQQIGSMTDLEKESVVVGNVVWNDLQKRISDGFGKALAGIDLGSKVWGNYIFGKDKNTGLSLTFGQAAEQAVIDQNGVISGIKQAAAEEMAAEAEKRSKAAKDAAQAAHWKKVNDYFNNYTANAFADNKAKAQARAQRKIETRPERIAIASEYNEQALLENLPGNPTAGERRNREQAEYMARRRAYGLQKPKTIREQMEDRIAARQKPRITAQEAINKLAAIIQQDAMTVRVKLAK